MFKPSSEAPSTGRLLKMFGRLAIPNMLTNFLGYMSIVTVTVYAGRLDEYINVAVMGLATTFCRMIVTTL